MVAPFGFLGALIFVVYVAINRVVMPLKYIFITQLWKASESKQNKSYKVLKGPALGNYLSLHAFGWIGSESTE